MDTMVGEAGKRTRKGRGGRGASVWRAGEVGAVAGACAAQGSATAAKKSAQHLNQALVLLGMCSNMTLKQAVNTTVGRTVRTNWIGWDRSADNEYALSAELLQWTPDNTTKDGRRELRRRAMARAANMTKSRAANMTKSESTSAPHP